MLDLDWSPKTHAYENMSYAVVQSCPLTFQEWSGRAVSKCSYEENYHCGEDEYSRIVEVCTVPIWIEQGILLWTMWNKIVTFFVALYNQVRVSKIRNSSTMGNNGSENLRGCELIYLS